MLHCGMIGFTMADRDERGWAVDISEWSNSADRQRPGQTVDIDFDVIDPASFYIRIDEGSGYSSQSCSTFIPIDIVVRMLEHAGYTVTRNP